MSRLSFILKIGINSMVAIIAENKIFSIIGKLVKNEIMINVVIKKEMEPSRDLLNKFVFPYFIPINAAAESEKLNIISEIIAIFS